MRRGAGGAACLAAAMAVTGGGKVSAQLPWEAGRWRIQAQESRIEEYLGREALFIRGGTAWLDGVSFRDGVVEFDMAASDAVGFHGLRFRAVDDRNHEHVYLRPHLSGRADATQYNPIFNGVSAWQLYADERYVLPVELPPDRWIHVRVAIRGKRMETCVDGGEPLVYPDLVREPVAGPIGLNSSAGPARFANVVVRPDADPGFTGGSGAAAVEAERVWWRAGASRTRSRRLRSTAPSACGSRWCGNARGRRRAPTRAGS